MVTSECIGDHSPNAESAFFLPAVSQASAIPIAVMSAWRAGFMEASTPRGTYARRCCAAMTSTPTSRPSGGTATTAIRTKPDSVEF